MQRFIQYDRDDETSKRKGLEISQRFSLGTRAELPLQGAIVFDVHTSHLESLQFEVTQAIKCGLKLKLGIPE